MYRCTCEATSSASSDALELQMIGSKVRERELAVRATLQGLAMPFCASCFSATQVYFQQRLKHVQQRLQHVQAALETCSCSTWNVHRQRLKHSQQHFEHVQ